MTEEKTIPTIHAGSNIQHIKDEIASGLKEVRSCKLERQDVNEAIASVRAHLETLGIRKAAFDMALRYLDWDEDKRQGFDLAYSLVREVGGSPIRHDLVTLADHDQIGDLKSALDLVTKSDGWAHLSDETRILINHLLGRDDEVPVVSNGDGSAVKMKSNGESRPLTGLQEAVAASDAAVKAATKKAAAKAAKTN